MANIVSPNVNYLLSKIVANSIKGCFYGFVNYKDIEDIMEDLEQDEHISIIKKGSICLCEVDPNYLVNNANTLQPDTYTKEDLDLIKKTPFKGVFFVVTKFPLPVLNVLSPEFPSGLEVQLVLECSLFQHVLR